MRVRRFWWWPFGRVPEIDAHELHSRLQGESSPQIVDVRTGLEWRNSHIAGSISAPVTQLREMLPSLGLDRDRPVVAICRTAHRSIPAVRMLRELGFDACQLREGMQAWWRADLPAESTTVDVDHR